MGALIFPLAFFIFHLYSLFVLSQFILASFFPFIHTFELHFLFFSFFFLFFFYCLISGSHHSGSPLARGARYHISADSSKVYTIPQNSSSGSDSRQGSISEACGQTKPEPELSVNVKPSDDDDEHEEAQGIEGPPDISGCGWVWLCVSKNVLNNSPTN